MIAANVPDLNSWQKHTTEPYTRIRSPLNEHGGLLKKHDGTLLQINWLNIISPEACTTLWTFALPTPSNFLDTWVAEQVVAFCNYHLTEVGKCEETPKSKQNNFANFSLTKDYKI